MGGVSFDNIYANHTLTRERERIIGDKSMEVKRGGRGGGKGGGGGKGKGINHSPDVISVLHMEVGNLVAHYFPQHKCKRVDI